MTTQRFSTADEAKAAIATALGDYADDYDIDAIFDATHQWRTDVDTDGRQHGDGWFQQTVDVDEFWAIAERHDTRGTATIPDTGQDTTAVPVVVERATGEHTTAFDAGDLYDADGEPAGPDFDLAAYLTRADTALTQLGWQRISDWTGGERPTCTVERIDR